jgi:alpha-mannosidase
VQHKVRWTAEKIARRIALIQPLVYRRRIDLPPFRYRPLADPSEDPTAEPTELEDGWETIAPNSYWGKARQNFVLRSHFEIPSDWDRRAPAALYLPLGEEGVFSHPEALAYIDGAPYAACDRHHQEIALLPQWRDGSVHELTLRGWTGLGGWGPGVNPGTRLLMHQCAVVNVDQPTRDFLCTARVALGVATSLDDEDPAKGRLLNALDEAFKALDTREPFDESFYESVADAHTVLAKGIERSGPPMDVEVVATGHAHLDVAWLWTLGQTRRKAERTFYTATTLMDQFPEYHFTQSQPQLYDYLRNDDPDLFEAIKKRVAEGRWEPIGGMWVEADCNVSGAESLARQFLLGRTFFREHFGAEAESPVLWLPDVFGYCWALPQLIKHAGLQYFMTIKIGWNQYNRLPYDSFWWRGLDGTRVLTHFSTTPEEGAYASTYNAKATPKDVIGTWTNFQQKDVRQQLLMMYGYGDGGGGPTREMLENIREMESFAAIPRVRQGSAGEFFRRLESDVGDELPTWNGELYLEYHRGTYTTQSRNKRANRKSEFLLHDAEFLSVLASLVDASYRYPSADLTEAWKLVCLNQFHDIIPGSSIGDVYVESLAQYREVERTATNVRDGALEAIAGSMGGEVLLVNPTSFPRDDLAFWGGSLSSNKLLETTDGHAVHTQPTADGTLVYAGPLNPFSVMPLMVRTGESGRPLESELAAGKNFLENGDVRVEFDDAGDIVRIFDKRAQREVLAEGGVANQLQAFEDRPLNWDAWDIDIFYDDKSWTSEPAEDIEVVENGPLRSTIQIRRRILSSDYIQRISLGHNSPRIDFDTSIEWRERNILLKVAFPVQILSPVATFEIQWGNVQRPTHRNTSWDWARFETSAQKWVDLSEGDYGVSLLNDCKHGHDVYDNVLRLSLLRSPTMPDPQADLGNHRFAYSLLPHEGAWSDSTVAAAYALNDPIIAAGPRRGDASSGQLAPGGSLVAVDSPNVVIETVKGAEDGRGFVVRLYESQRRRGPVTLTSGIPLARASRTNLLEEDESKLTLQGNTISMELRPYEIATVRLVPAS